MSGSLRLLYGAWTSPLTLNTKTTIVAESSFVVATSDGLYTQMINVKIAGNVVLKRVTPPTEVINKCMWLEFSMTCIFVRGFWKLLISSYLNLTVPEDGPTLSTSSNIYGLLTTMTLSFLNKHWQRLYSKWIFHCKVDVNFSATA